MKIILTILATTGFVATTSTTVVACGPKEDTSFKIPSYPKTEKEAKQNILSFSSKTAQTFLEIKNIYKTIDELSKEQIGNQQKISELAKEVKQKIIDQNYLENEYILRICLFALKDINPSINFVEYFKYNEKTNSIKKNIEDINFLLLNNSLDYNFENLNSTIDEFKNDNNQWKETKNISKMLQNLNNIRQWWLKGKQLNSFKDEFITNNLGKIKIDKQNFDKELIQEILKVKKQESKLSINDIKIITINDNSSVIVAPVNNAKFIGEVHFEYILE